jgi:DNA-binding CsgD family transcriptional regulator
MTTRLEQIYLERFRRLPPAAQRMLLAVASDDSEELRIVIAAARALDASEKDLDVAERSGLVSVNGTRVEFRHPLVRSAIYSAATSGERREVHGAFAAALRNGAAEEDRRAWHLANSVVDTDDEIAQILEGVADRAESRGAYASAARTLQRAVDLSADHAARARRLVRAATDASNAGLDDEAVALARRAQDVVVAPELRAEIASVLGLHELRRGTPIDAYPMLLEAANDVAQIEPAKAIELLMYALSAASTSGNDLLQLEASSAAAKVPRPEDDDARMLATLVAGFGADVDGDLSRTASILKPAIEMAYDAKDSYVILLRSIAALVVGDDARYEELLTRSIATARERGRLGVLAEALAVRASQLFMLQRYDEAHQAAKEALEFGREVRAENHMLMPLGVIAAVAAFRGDDDEARRTAEAVIEAGTAKRLPVRAGFGHYVLGMLDFVQGRWESALGRFEFVAALSTVHAMRVAPDRVEAGLRAGRREEAADITASFERWTEQLGASWGRPRAMSCRALLSEGDEATAYFEEAIADIDAARPFDRARIHLLYGEHLRRARQRAEARTHLHIALKEFDRFGALPWANRATAELRATGETVRKRDPDTLDKLTPQEIQISRLVAEGMSNKEVAALLFLSPRTIEYHLRSVFSKLGLTSRTQLARVDLAVYDAPAPSAVGAAS